VDETEGGEVPERGRREVVEDAREDVDWEGKLGEEKAFQRRGRKVEKRNVLG
jgi:hypothetical protein